MTTAIIPERQVAPLWESFHGLPAAGHEMRAAVVIEPAPWYKPLPWFPVDAPAYRVTSGQPLQIAQ